MEGGLRQYISTRGEAPALGFCDVMLTGLARDGGLYVPETWPRLAPADLRALRDMGVTAIDIDFTRPSAAAMIAEMSRFKAAVIDKI